MEQKRGVIILLAILAVLLGSSSSSALPNSLQRSSACNGSIGECLEEDEFLIDSDIYRRLLQQHTKYLSYGAISHPDSPASPKPAKSGKPYTRGCKKIHHCPGGT